MEESTNPCPSCGYPNRPGKKFCGGCGSPLVPRCPACGSENPPGARFCDECGSPLAAAAPPAQAPAAPTPAATPSPAPQVAVTQAPPVAPPATPNPHATPATAPPVATAPAPQAPVPPPVSGPSEERRLVTALFCDLVNFTPLSEMLDPEEVREIQGEYFGAMSALIERFSGVVEKYAGDAVLALFGAPIAHEDDAERAVLCALDMQAAIVPIAERTEKRFGVRPAIRVGVNTGEVISGTWNASGRQDVAVTGDAVNTAARIQAAANPGEVLVGMETMRLTRRRVRFGERRDLVLKGKTGTVPGFQALGLREQFGERWETGRMAAPLVGRDRELVTLLDAWNRARDGEGQLVSIVGDAGVGKSRLMSELMERVSQSSAVRVVRARCLSYGQEISLWLVADLLRTLFGVQEQDPLEEVLGKVSEGVRVLLPARHADARAEATDVIGEVLGLPPGQSALSHAGAQIRRQALIRDLRLILGALAEQSPTIILLEDLHWLDASSQDILAEILPDVPGMRLLILAAQRPGWNAPWSEWGWTERVTLRPLREEDAAILAGAVLGGARLSPELQRYVADRAGGNPFFVEEMLRALQETGDIVERSGQMALAPGAEERLPTTLTEVLLARLDRLEGEVKSVAQVASVIGRSFAVRLLAQVVGQTPPTLDPPLMALQRAEIAFPRRGSDIEYVFKHVSMREVAYHTLVQKRRRQLHLQAARAIAALYPTDEYVEMIAYHFARTEEHVEAAEWLERAGDRAASIYANETAINNYEEARRRVDLIGAGAAAQARLDEKLGMVLKTVGRYGPAQEALERAAAVYEEERNLEAMGRVTAAIGWVHRYQGTPEDGIARIRPVIELLVWNGPSPALAALQLALANLYFASGKYRECGEAASRASALARAIGDDRILAGAEMRRGTALSILGQADEGYQALEGSLPIAERAGDLDTLSLALNNLGDAYLRGGELTQSRTYLERSLELAERVGHLANVGFQLVNLGEVTGYMGEWDESREHIERAAEVIQTVGASWWSAYPFLQRGQLAVLTGRWEDARGSIEECIAIAEPSGDLQALENAYWLLAELDLVEGQADAVRDRLEPLLKEEGPMAVILLATLAEAYLQLGEIDLAETTVSRALVLAGDRQHRLHTLSARRVQGAVLRARGRYMEAQETLEEALTMARAMPYPHAEASGLYEQGLTWMAQGNPQEAWARLKLAETIFRRLGARPYLDRVEKALAQLP